MEIDNIMQNRIVLTRYLYDSSLDALSDQIDALLIGNWEMYGSTQQFEGDCGAYFAQLLVKRKSQHPQTDILGYDKAVDFIKQVSEETCDEIDALYCMACAAKQTLRELGVLRDD